MISWRTFILRGNDRGRPSWYYILLDDDAEKIKDFIHKTQGEGAGKYTISPDNYGTVLRSGWGKDPSQEDEDWIKNYGWP